MYKKIENKMIVIVNFIFLFFTKYDLFEQDKDDFEMKRV